MIKRIPLIFCVGLVASCSNEPTQTVHHNESNRFAPSATSGSFRYDHDIAKIGRQEGVDPKLIHAVIRQESNYDPNALSPVGAAGLMQLMPATAQDYGLAPHQRYDPIKNIRAGTRHLKRLMKMFNGNLRLVLAAYNAGQGNVIKYGYTVPPFQETQDYVRRVTGYYRAHQRLARIPRENPYQDMAQLAQKVDTVEPNVEPEGNDES